MQQGKPDTDAAKATIVTLLSPLTKREHEVLELMAFGLANKEIADRLSLSRRTIESHIDHVLGKLNVPTRARAVVEAGRAGLLGGTTTSAAASAADIRPNNLPFQLTTLLGREQDLVEAKSLLKAHRLVTLSGSGGVGKTRLALRLGVDLVDLYPNGAWLCDFSPISDPGLVASAVAKALVVRERQDRPLVESIVDSLKRKRALLIFDNCEAQDTLNIALALQHLTLLGALHREVVNAARLIGYVNVQLKELGSEREYTEKWGYEKLMAALRERLSEAEIEELAAEGAAWSEDRAVEEALKV